jgi:hypothetical protein
MFLLLLPLFTFGHVEVVVPVASLWHGLPSHNGLLRPAALTHSVYTADIDSASPVRT